MANSSMLVLPRITAPASSKRSITCASYGPTKFERIFEPQVVSQSRATKMSLSEAFSMNSGSSPEVLAADLAARPDPLLDHLGNQIESLLHLRCNRLEALPLVAFGDLVFPQAQGRSLGMRHRSYALGVDLLHPSDQLEDVVEIGQDGLRFLLAYAYPSERGDLQNLF